MLPFLNFPHAAIFAEESLSMKAVTVYTIPGIGFEITNSMIVMVIASLLVIAFVQVAMRQPKLVPTGLQNFIEWIVEVLSNLLEQILGRDMVRRTFWFFASIFVFIVGCNIVSLLPGMGTIGYGHGTSPMDFEVDQPFFRGANADVNMTAAMAALFFFLWFYWAFSKLGLIGFFKHVFASPVKFGNVAANYAFSLIFFVVGIVELISILVIRPLAFTFRLYGNIYGGEFLLDSIYKMAPHFAWALLVPFYVLELLVAFIQAFVFCILTAVFTGIICNSGHDHAEEAH